jgi:hypothetical protein
VDTLNEGALAKFPLGGPENQPPNIGSITLFRIIFIGDPAASIKPVIIKIKTINK